MTNKKPEANYLIASRTILLLSALTILASCALPRTGPNKREIFAGSVLKGGTTHIVEVNDEVNQLSKHVPDLGFPKSFTNAGVLGADTIAPGDILALNIWENVDNGLFSAGSPPPSQAQVDGSGYIYVPFAGRIKAAGNSPETVRRIITEKLSEQTPDPQVQIARTTGSGSTVTITGKTGQGVFPIERATRRLSSMLSAAGGTTVEPETAQVRVLRGNQSGTAWYNDLFTNPKLDIALRDGDRILVEADPRSFTILGATGQTVVPFLTRDVSALEAIAQVGGLNTSLADPTGVFVFRDENQNTARRVLGDDNLVGSQRLAYSLNLTEPNGLFLARDFALRDGDTVFVTESPFIQWQKALFAVTGSLSSVNALGATAGVQ